MSLSPPRLDLREGRFARLEEIDWWRQDVLREARVLVVGAGALGNEVIKNLALLGVGHLLITDMDRVELSNLSRSVLFRATDEGAPKAECAARAAAAIYPDIDVAWRTGNVLADLGLGWFHWAQVVVGALDNREARVFVNSACARVGRPWVDGGVEVLHGVARAFSPPTSSCYECTMSRTDWDQINKRRSCSLLARRALAARGVPTTPTTASIIGAIQAQEVVKLLHGMDALVGRGFVYDGQSHSSYTVEYPVKPDCPWHEPPPSIERMTDLGSNTPLATIRRRAQERLGDVDALDLSREIVRRLDCPACGRTWNVFRPLDTVSEKQALCPGCGNEGVPLFMHSLGNEPDLLRLTPRELGLPAWDILWARRDERAIGMELAADAPHGQSS